MEPGFEKVGYRHRVVAIRVFLEPRRYQHPSQRYAEHLTHDHPQGVDPHGVPHARETNQQPRAFTGRVAGKRDDPGGKFLAGYEIPGDVLGGPPSPQPDPQEDRPVDNENDDDGRCHLPPPSIRSIRYDLNDQADSHRPQHQQPGRRGESGYQLVAVTVSHARVNRASASLT